MTNKWRHHAPDIMGGQATLEREWNRVPATPLTPCLRLAINLRKDSEREMQVHSAAEGTPMGQDSLPYHASPPISPRLG